MGMSIMWVHSNATFVANYRAQETPWAILSVLSQPQGCQISVSSFYKKGEQVDLGLAYLPCHFQKQSFA